MSQAKAERAIEAKRVELDSRDRGLGDAAEKVKPASSGGFGRPFAQGHIYWHANTGAHEVHGKVLERYLHLGGPGANPNTGRRDLGYPTSDEETGHLGEATSSFEFGRIHAVPAFRPAAGYGPAARGLPPGRDGIPICEPIRIQAGEILFTRGGCRFAPDAIAPAVLRADLNAPQLGHPELIHGDPAEDLPVTIRWHLEAKVWAQFLASHGGDENRAADALAMAWADRLAVRSVGDASVQRAILVRVAGPATPTLHGVPPAQEIVLRLRCRLAGNEPLPDRRLYDLVVRLSATEVYAVGSHALYARRDWQRFGFIHATDLHVTRRAERYRAKLRAAGGHGRGVRELVNPNDSLRAMIRYANALHERGEIDFILATGDLVDYVFEGDDAGDRRVDTNNFAHLHRILLGRVQPSDPGGDVGDELRVPIFTVLGNHDYVLNRAPLFFKVDVLGPFRNPAFRRWYGYNLTSAETRTLQDGDVPTVSEEAAVNMLESGEHALSYYLSEINQERNYLIDIDGRHRIVMIDSGPNKDDIGSRWDVLEHWLGFSEEDERTFALSLPNSQGRDDDTFNRARKLSRTGVFVVGMHAPPLNTWGSQYPHFFRETERVAIDPDRLKALTLGYLFRQVGGAGLSGHDGWHPGRARHFKRGSITDLLDFGITKFGSASPDEFVKQLIAGAVDMVLCGHVHERVEFRVRLDSKNEPLVFTDFYTENLPSFRASNEDVVRDLTGSKILDRDGPIFLRVTAKAKIGAKPRDITDRSPEGLPKGTVMTFRSLDIPPYDDPLADAANKAAWWNKHRPLILQTACVGPLDYVQRSFIDSKVTPPRARRRHASFQGIRLVSVEGDHIARVSHVGMEQLRRPPKRWLEPVLHMMMIGSAPKLEKMWLEPVLHMMMR